MQCTIYPALLYYALNLFSVYDPLVLADVYRQYYRSCLARVALTLVVTPDWDSVKSRQFCKLTT